MAEIATVWVDFNDVDETGRVVTLRKFFAPGASVELGRRFLAGDDEGNTCPATVAWVGDDGRVALELDRDHFVTGNEVRAVQS